MNQHSAIGRFSAHAANRLLARGHRVHILATELEPAPVEFLQETNATITHWSRLTSEEMRRDYDIVIVNIGDHYLYHAGIFWIMEQVPTLAVFHDYYLYDLFHGWLWDKSQTLGDAWRNKTHDRVVMETYGLDAASVRQLREEVQSGAMPLEMIANKTPMTEWILKRCGAAFGHARFYLDRLQAGCVGPVAWARLAAVGRDVPLVLERPDSGETLIALTVGIMNPNKCVDRVIEAIGRTPSLSHRLEYRLAGPISFTEQARLTNLAESFNYKGLRIFGQVDEAELTRHLTESDIICCLRRPVLEGASGSAVEALLAGRPLIVADAGFYAELPDDVVFKVPQEIPLEALSDRLVQLVGDEALRLAAGELARHWAEYHLNMDHYLEQLEQLVRRFIDEAPLLRLGRHVGGHLAALGVQSGDQSIFRIARALNELVNDHQ